MLEYNFYMTVIVSISEGYCPSQEKEEVRRGSLLVVIVGFL